MQVSGIVFISCHQDSPYLFIFCAPTSAGMSANFYCNLILGVHDSYWTHACDVEQMNKILREKFVELYDAPILENVSFSKSLSPI